MVHAILVGLITLIAAVRDWQTHKLPNRLTLPMFLGGCLFHLGQGWLIRRWSGAGEGLLFALAGFATGFTILLMLWLVGGGGGGDVKLMGGLGAWLGPQLILAVFLLSVLIVLFYTVLLWFVRLRSASPRMISPSSSESSTPPAQSTGMPYAVPVALATWCVLAYETVLPLVS